MIRFERGILIVDATTLEKRLMDRIRMSDCLKSKKPIDYEGQVSTQVYLLIIGNRISSGTVNSFPAVPADLKECSAS